MAIRPFTYENIQSLDTGDASIIPRDHLADSLNMTRRDDGLWENRKGFTQFGSDVGSGEPIHSLHFWKTSLGARYLTVGTDTDLYSYTEGSSYDDGTYSNEKTLTVDSSWEATNYRDTILIGNGNATDGIQTSTDNITFTTRTGSNIYPARLLSQANDFVGFSDVTGDKDKLFLTAGAPASPWITDPNNVLNVDIGNADDINALQSLGAQIIVAKSKKTYSVDLVSLNRTTIDWGGGCESSRAVLQTQSNSLYIAGRQGIFTIARTQIGNNQIFGNPESELVKRLYKATTDYSTINTVYTFEDNYAIFVCETRNGKIALVKNLDFSNPVWTYFSGINATGWATYEDDNGDLHYLFADAATDRIWELFKGRSDNGAPILSRIAFKNDNFDLPGVFKNVSTIDITGFISAGGIWNVEVYINDDINTPFKTVQITHTAHAQQTSSIVGLGSSSLASSPLGELVLTDDDIAVDPFFRRINIHEKVEKLQVIMWNNQSDVRVVFDSMVVYAEAEPYDYYPNANIT
jgi:hypothetical protein